MDSNKKAALIIDDSGVNRHLLNLYLQKMGYETYFAEDGEKGLEKFKTIRPFFTFLDIVMPRKCGLEILKELKKIDSNAIVIMVSSFVTNENLNEAKRLGADWFIMKPFTRKKLIEIVKKFEETSE